MSQPRLRKELRLLDVYAIATGATLSAGFFLLPGIAAQLAGPALPLVYMLAAIPLIPATFSIVELATAMPRAGGVYYFLDRSLGPMVGTIGGLGTWLALVLKVAFALVGIEAYLSLFLPNVPTTAMGVGIAVVLAGLSLRGAKGSGGFQLALVAGLLAILAGFIGHGLPQIEMARFSGFLGAGFDSIAAAAGLVYISYVGVTNVASLSEEVDDPEHNLPRAVFLSLATALLVYFLGTAVMVGVIPAEQLAGDLAPVATAAEITLGGWGKLLVSLGALLAFVSVANAGMLSASRYPLAMSRDQIAPRWMGRLTSSGVPVWGVILTLAMVISILLFLDPTKIAKLASAFQLLMFALVCLAVIVMRESHLEAYDPGYRSPLYPWMQIFGVLSPLWLISEMGLLPLLFSAGLLVLGVAWYLVYARFHVVREGAIYHLFERLGRQRDDNLERELRGILKEKGLRDADPFDDIVGNSDVLDLEEGVRFEEVVSRVAPLLAERVPASVETIEQELLQGTRLGATPVTHGVALPHFRCRGLAHPAMVLVRSLSGVRVEVGGEGPDERQAHALFFLVSPYEDPGQHLRILAQLASRMDEDGFLEEWQAARHELALKEVLLRDERFLSVRVHAGTATESLIGQSLREIALPEGCLVAMLRRDGVTRVPRGRTVLAEGDRLTIIGEPAEIHRLEARWRD